MEIILSKSCASLTGTLSKKHGYYIRKCVNLQGESHFYSQKCPRGSYPKDGHLDFIMSCIELTDSYLADDIRISAEELMAALDEAGIACPYRLEATQNLNARAAQKYINDMVN